MQDQASGEDQFLWPTIFPTSIPSWSTRYDCGIQPLTPYWSIVFSFKSKRTGRVILFWLMIFWAALFLSPSMVIKRKINLSLLSWENFSRATCSSLQDCHQVAQKTIRTGFPLKSLKETWFPSKPLREKAGACFFSWGLWTPKEPQEAHSGWEGEAALTTWRQGMRMIVIPIMIESERTILFFISTSIRKIPQRTNRLLKNARLHRFPHPSSLQRTSKYASFLSIACLNGRWKAPREPCILTFLSSLPKMTFFSNPLKDTLTDYCCVFIDFIA